MVSKASEDLPEPESPVMTTSCSRGRSSKTFSRWCSRAPRMEMNLEVILSVMSAWPRPSARLSPQWVGGQGEGRSTGDNWIDQREFLEAGADGARLAAKARGDGVDRLALAVAQHQIVLLGRGPGGVGLGMALPHR